MTKLTKKELKVRELERRKLEWERAAILSGGQWTRETHLKFINSIVGDCPLQERVFCDWAWEAIGRPPDETDPFSISYATAIAYLYLELRYLDGAGEDNRATFLGDVSSKMFLNSEQKEKAVAWVHDRLTFMFAKMEEGWRTLFYAYYAVTRLPGKFVPRQYPDSEASSSGTWNERARCIGALDRFVRVQAFRWSNDGRVFPIDDYAGILAWLLKGAPMLRVLGR